MQHLLGAAQIISAFPNSASDPFTHSLLNWYLDCTECCLEHQHQYSVELTKERTRLEVYRLAMETKMSGISQR